ncbi:MAG TPA: GNAT family N-acetyltransferase [Xanthobacteraceae bacterium]|nr:GNAT family N-acetyltransferase [Xanthobacteraceae bacterium]
MTAFRNASARAAAIPFEADRTAHSRDADMSPGAAPEISFRIHTSLAAVESEWRRFEQGAAATPFQTYEWLAAWHRHIGIRSGVVPVIVVGHLATGEVAFILPLAIHQRPPLRRLSWLGQDLCDYNAPLLSRDFCRRVSTESFHGLWRRLQAQMQSDRETRYDWIDFEKMPATIGTEINPFIGFELTPNANSAHMMYLGDDWETFYRAKRSSATRRHDRAKHKRMAQFGDVRFVTAAAPADARTALETLMRQKGLAFSRKGISDMFARPGCREFFLDFASNPATRHLAHVSRLEIGSIDAAVNFGIVRGDCYYHILSSYCDGRVAHFGPGALHLRELMAHAINLGLRKFDFTIGDERYKNEWCDEQLRLFDYSAAATWRGWPASALCAARRRLKRTIKQTPLMWSAASQFRAAFGALFGARRA